MTEPLRPPLVPASTGSCSLDEDAYREPVDAWHATPADAASTRDGATTVWTPPAEAIARLLGALPS
ncbi:hypothetical protein PWG71_03030 [Nocardiopsis sp. N85]|uniref:hypothetical protein n=1 Tax=Nocardiopsis sp. N85 TaxID=3029400 RepID=UPI00237F0617|nr:hypothetical protein [Nocardiopsis sp. N85]MDE3720347.1 hypothetical protein [Nocardiopsis sp. N85]